MKKNDWILLANRMWKHSEENEGKISDLIKELIYKIHSNNLHNMVIIDDMGECE